MSLTVDLLSLVFGLFGFNTEGKSRARDFMGRLWWNEPIRSKIIQCATSRPLALPATADQDLAKAILALTSEIYEADLLLPLLQSFVKVDWWDMAILAADFAVPGVAEALFLPLLLSGLTQIWPVD
jgi:hypothetical protein